MKIIIFDIDNTTYGIKMDNIKEIMPYPTRIAKLPNQNSNIIGVTNIRGKVSSILNINQILNTNKTESKYIIIIEKDNKIICFPTEKMPQTLDITMDEISTNFIGKSDYISGILNTKIGLVALMNEINLLGNENN
jgi:purine-binding chemotaxis protein CheW